GTEWNTLSIPAGNYTSAQLTAVISNMLTAAGDDPEHLVLTPNYSTSRFELSLSGGYKVDFTGLNIATVFGADQIEYDASISFPQHADITYGVNSCLVNCDVLDGTMNGAHG